MKANCQTDMISIIIQSKTTENVTFGIPYYQLHVRIHMEPLPHQHPQHNLLDSL